MSTSNNNLLPPPKINNVCVIGGGLMGSGIAAVCAFHGYHVGIVDLDATGLEDARKRAQFQLAKMVEAKRKGTQANGIHNKPQSLQQICARLNFTVDLSAAVKNADLIVESIVENLPAKRELLQRIIRHIPPSNLPIIISNTSSLLIADIGRDLPNSVKAHFAGLHFFNPVPKMPLVEVIPSAEMGSQLVDRLKAFVKSIGKVPLICKDTPGFLANRILIPLMAESIGLVERGVAEPEAVDKACQLGLGLPIGPFRLMDFVGLDTAHNIIQGWQELYPQEFPAFRKSKILAQLVAEGKKGRKTGEGFYKYSSKL